MSSRVYAIAPDVVGSDSIRSGNPVEGTQWASAAQLANHVAGNGGTLIPAMHHMHGFTYDEGEPPYGPAIPSGETKEFKYWVYPRAAAHTRLWVLRVASKYFYGGGLHSYIPVFGYWEINDDSEIGIIVQNYSHNITSLITKQIYSPSNTPEEQSIAITNLSDTSMFIEQIACYELPRYQIKDDETNVKHANQESCRKGNVIRDQDERSVYGVYQSLENSKDECRRNNLYHYSTPDGAYVVSTETSYTHLFGVDIGPELLGRKLTSASANDTLRCNVLAAVDSTHSGTAQIRITPSYTGATSYVMNVNTAVATWYSASGIPFLTRAEDLSAVDGRVNSVWTTLTIEGKVDTATSMVVYAISIGEMNGD